MNRFRVFVLLSLTLIVVFSATAGAQTLSTTVTVVPSVTLAIATASGGLTVSGNAINFGSWGAYGYTSTGTVTFVPVSSGSYSVYTPVNVSVQGANASTYGLTAYGTPPVTTGLTGTAPSLLLGLASSGAPGAVSTNSGSPTTLVASTTTVSNTAATTTTVNVGYAVPTTLVKTAGGSFALGGSINFTATAN
jgi:hypothetical protein